MCVFQGARIADAHMLPHSDTVSLKHNSVLHLQCTICTVRVLTMYAAGQTFCLFISLRLLFTPPSFFVSLCVQHWRAVFSHENRYQIIIIDQIKSCFYQACFSRLFFLNAGHNGADGTEVLIADNWFRSPHELWNWILIIQNIIIHL